MASSNISSSGQIKNLQHMGFTDQDAQNELIDNSFDAQATTVCLRLDSATKTLTIVDDGKGMNKANLYTALRFHDVKAASENIGLRGLGLNAAHVVLSDAAHNTRIFSKAAGGDTYEIEAPWPEAIQADFWDPRPADLSRARESIWETGKIAETGTISVIPMVDTHFNRLCANLEGMCSELGRTYETFLRSGKQILVSLDGVSYPVNTADGLNWDDTAEEMRNEVPIKVLRHPETREERVYYQHTCRRPEWVDMVRANPDPRHSKKPMRDYQMALEQGFECVGECVLRSVYDPTWNPTDVDEDDKRMPYVPGYISPARNGRFLHKLNMDFPTSGTFEKRRVIAASRHGVMFEHGSDHLFGVEVNKSNVTEGKVHSELLRVIRFLTKGWAGSVFERSREAPQKKPNADFEARVKRAMKKLKQVAHAHPEEFFAEFDQWVADWEGDMDTVDDESV